MQAIIVYYLAVNILLFVLFGWDKAQARRGARRIAEKTLLGLGLIGGAVGGITGQYVFRHKTKKPIFLAVYLLSLVLHLGGWYLLGYDFVGVLG